MLAVLRQACELDRPDVIDLCLELGVDVLQPLDENGGNCWHVACAHGSVASVERLGQKSNRAKRIKALQSNDSNGFTPLVWCCRQGKVGLIQTLLPLKLDVNLEAANGAFASVLL
jgi:ankyrin repeat protein